MPKSSPEMDLALADVQEAFHGHQTGPMQAALRRYLSAGGNLDTADRAYPLLHRAALSATLVKFLLDQGADPEVTDSSGRTLPHHILMRADGDSKRFIATLKVWLAFHPRVDRPGPRGETPLYNASTKCGPRGRYLKLVQLFVAAGADCDLAPKKNPHLLSVAVRAAAETDAIKLIRELRKAKPSKAAIAQARSEAMAKGFTRAAKLLV